MKVGILRLPSEQVNNEFQPDASFIKKDRPAVLANKYSRSLVKRPGNSKIKKD